MADNDYIFGDPSVMGMFQGLRPAADTSRELHEEYAPELAEQGLYMTPLGVPMAARDAVRDFQSGNYGGGALNTALAAMGAIPAAGAGVKAAKTGIAASKAAKAAASAAAHEQYAMSQAIKGLANGAARSALNKAADNILSEMHRARTIGDLRYSSATKAAEALRAKAANYPPSKSGARWSNAFTTPTDSKIIADINNIWPGPIDPALSPGDAAKSLTGNSDLTNFLKLTDEIKANGQYMSPTALADELDNLYGNLAGF